MKEIKIENCSHHLNDLINTNDLDFEKNQY